MSPSSDEQGTDIAHHTVVVGVRITRAGSAASVKMQRCAELRASHSRGKIDGKGFNTLEDAKNVSKRAGVMANGQWFTEAEVQQGLAALGRTGFAALGLALSMQGGTHDSCFEENLSYMHVDCLLGLCRQCQRPRPRRLFTPHHAPGHSRPTGGSVIDEGGSDRGGPPHLADGWARVRCSGWG